MHGGDAASAVAVKRFHHQFLPDAIQFEPGGFTPEVAAARTARGHLLKPLERSYGNMQVVWWDRAKRQVQAASDPRGVGAAELRKGELAGICDESDANRRPATAFNPILDQ